MICAVQPELQIGGGTPAPARERKPKPTIPERWAAWKLTPGGRFSLRMLYIIIAGFYRAWKFEGKPKPSKRLVWETLRFCLDENRGRKTARGQELKREQGYWLNDNLTALAFDHVAQRRPEFAIFEDRDHAGDMDQPATPLSHVA